tara:strand:+ start:43780 stop:44760 length:981 start_codon:yes stop_codon:yes gene_type:complete
MNKEIKNRLIDIANLNNNALLLIGCKTTKYSHKCCEYNILTIGESNESKIITDKILGYVELKNIKREEFLEIGNKNASFLLNNETIIDDNFTISTKIKDINEHKDQIIKQYIKSTDIELTTDIERANNALKKSSNNDAAYWAHSAAYNLIKLSIAYDKIIMSPTHLLNQLKEKITEFNIDEYYNVLDLENATKSSVERRLQALNDLYRLLSIIISGNQEIFLRKMKLIDNKIRWFLENKMITNAFSLLGYENLSVIRKIYEQYCKQKHITSHNYKIIDEIIEENYSPGIGKSTIKMLMITTDQQEINEKLDKINNLRLEIIDNISD